MIENQGLLLRKAGEHIFGVQWKAKMARALRVSRRYVHLLADEQRPMNRPLFDRLVAFCDANGYSGFDGVEPPPERVRVATSGPDVSHKVWRRWRFCPYCGHDLTAEVVTYLASDTSNFSHDDAESEAVL